MTQLTILKAVILGAIQGATEFLPVSSSGHLVIAQGLFGLKLEGGQMAAFDVCLHIGTLVAVIFVFWREIIHILSSLLKFSKAPAGAEEVTNTDGLKDSEARRMGIFLIIGTIPAVIFGLSFKHALEKLFEAPLTAAIMLIITGFILWTTRFAKKPSVSQSNMKWWHALSVGIAQAVAILPGISRSGSTISGGLLLGLDPALAARFAFLLSIPAIGGAAILEIKNLLLLAGDQMLPTIVGSVVSAFVGVVCIKWLLGIIRRGHFSWFAYYCWAVGLAATVYFLIEG